MPLQVIHVIRELTDKCAPKGSRKISFVFENFDQTGGPTWEPPTDIFETEEHVYIRLEIAGVNRKDVCIKIKNSKLFISGWREPALPQQQIYYHQMEINGGNFIKMISLPEALEHNEISAHLHEGLLEIKISKKGQVIEIPILSDLSAKDYE